LTRPRFSQFFPWHPLEGSTFSSARTPPPPMRGRTHHPWIRAYPQSSGSSRDAMVYVRCLTLSPRITTRLSSHCQVLRFPDSSFSPPSRVMTLVPVYPCSDSFFSPPSPECPLPEASQIRKFFCLSVLLDLSRARVALFPPLPPLWSIPFTFSSPPPPPPLL